MGKAVQRVLPGGEIEDTGSGLPGISDGSSKRFAVCNDRRRNNSGSERDTTEWLRKRKGAEERADHLPVKGGLRLRLILQQP